MPPGFRENHEWRAMERRARILESKRTQKNRCGQGWRAVASDGEEEPKKIKKKIKKEPDKKESVRDAMRVERRILFEILYFFGASFSITTSILFLVFLTLF